MIIHIWMHWFWITTVYFKAFLLFAGQTISLSCISVAEAGLLENLTTPLILDSFNGTTSSQEGIASRSTSPTVTQEEDGPPETTPFHLPDPPPPSPPQEEEVSTTLNEEKSASEPTSDTEDVRTGGTLDGFQYPMKKFTKYSHLKYGKAKGKGKSNEEEGGGESVRLVEEKLDINISVTEVDRSNESSIVPEETTVPGTEETPNWATSKSFTENVTERANESLPVWVNETRGATPEEERDGEVLSNETLVIESKVEEGPTAHTTVEPFAVRNRVAAATSAQNYEVGPSDLNAGSITGITLGILVVFSLFGAVSFVMYRRRYLNKPQVLHDKCSNLDSSGYIDETSLRENSEEMYSLDNDSFLNSLEAMTIQNYWTENVKHTKL